MGLLGAFASVISANPANGQTSGTTEITGGEGVVSVVSAPGRTISSGTGSPPAGAPAVWPYNCRFFAGVTLESEAIPVKPEPDRIYHLLCLPRPGFEDRPRIDNIAYVYDPATSIDPAQPDLITADAIRRVAENRVNPTDLPPAFSPEAQQITGIETWLWPDGPTESTSVWAAAGGLTVTIESRYRETEFTMTGANNGAVLCDDAAEWSPGADDSDCTFTFREEGEQNIAAETTWDLYWWDNAASPTPQLLGTITEALEETVEVVDLEAVITRN